MMTKKHFNKAAAMIRDMSRSTDPKTIRPIQDGKVPKGRECQGIAIWTAREAFVVLFAGDNERFDADRFREACRACMY